MASAEEAVSKLRIAPGLELDADYMGGGTFALLAKKGAGKTYQGRVICEELWKAKVPFVALDPMDAWWGLRAAADGKGEGIPVAIFGGPHGDAPLERTSGKLMADLVVDEGLSMVLSLKHFGSRAAERQFALDFLERLYRRNSELVHLLIDEADLFAPQKPQEGDKQLLGVTENIVRRGRNSGIGITLITQRPAVLNKDVLTQVDGLCVMRMLGPQDRDAIDDWVGEHGDTGLGKDVKGSLPDLATGECWWWVPELGVLKRVTVRAARTFDSSPTRKRGHQGRDPKSFADVDMGAIEKLMADTIERAKAEDPKELRARIRELEKQLRDRPAEAEPQTVVETIEVPVEVPVLKPGNTLETVLLPVLRKMPELLEQATAELQKLLEETAATTNGKGGPHGTERQGARRTEPPARRDLRPARKALEHARRPGGGASRDVRQEAAPAEGDFTPSGPQQRILDALAALEAIGVPEAHKTQLALFSKASPKSSAYTNNLGALRTAGLIEYPVPGRSRLTEAGRALADGGSAPSSVEELHDFVFSLVGKAKARLLSELIDVYEGEPLTKQELAERAGASATSSAFTNNLGNLRSLGLIGYPGPGLVEALPVLFLEGA